MLTAIISVLGVVIGFAVSAYFHYLADKSWRKSIAYGGAVIVLTGILAALVYYDSSSSKDQGPQTDKRAWVGIREITFRGEMKAGASLFAVIKVENTGQTPALETTINHTLTFQKPSKELIVRLPKIGTFGKIVIAPGKTFAAVQMFSTSLGEWEIEKFNKQIPYVFGRIMYKDVFGSEHETWFCAFYRPDFFPALRFCDTLNDMS